MLGLRVASALVMAAGFVLADYLLPAQAWAGLALALTAACAFEWSGLAPFRTSGRWLGTAALVGACAAAAVWSGLAGGPAEAHRSAAVYLIGALFWVSVAPWSLRYRLDRWPPLAVLALAFPVLVPFFLALLELRAMGPSVLLLVMAVVWIADTAAYFTGRAAGRRRLAPGISPGKTWEGVGGALVALAVYAAWLCVFPPASLGIHVAAWVLVPMLMLLGAVSVEGDLFESLLKRRAGVKDSGRLIPGHGGMLDRMDAQFAMLPFALIGLQLARSAG